LTPLLWVAVRVALLVVAACARSPADTLAITDPYAAEPVSREVGAVYLTIRNRSQQPDTLLGASTPVALMVHLHRMAAEGATGSMRTTDVAEIPAGGALELKPGGLHLMLMTLTSRPRVGDTIDVTLDLAHHGLRTVRVPVVSYLEVAERAAVGGRGDQ
jgi:hypothetical protein